MKCYKCQSEEKVNGIPEDVATGWVVKGLEDLQAKGVKSIGHVSEMWV